VNWREGGNSGIGLCRERRTCMGIGRTGIPTCCNDEKSFGSWGKKCGFLSPVNLLLCCMPIYVPFVRNMRIGRRAIVVKSPVSSHTKIRAVGAEHVMYGGDEHA